MLPESDIKKIKEMSNVLDIKVIAQTYQLPVDVVEEIIRGNITSDSNAIPESKSVKPTIKVVEKTRFVRNKTVTAISPGGGKGKTTLLTSLAVAAAIHNPGRRAIGILDLSEFPKVLASLGIDLEPIGGIWEDMLYWDENSDYSSYIIPHPALDNLHIIPGIPFADNHLQLSTDKMIGIIHALQNHFEIAFVDLPASFSLINQLLPFSDAIFITLTPDYGSIEGIIQLLPTLNRLDLLNRSFIVFNRIGYPGLLNINDCRKLLYSMMNDLSNVADSNQAFPEILGLIPETQEVLQLNGQKENLILKDSNSAFTKEIKHILSNLRPDWPIKTGKNKGILGRLFKRA